MNCKLLLFALFAYFPFIQSLWSLKNCLQYLGWSDESRDVNPQQQTTGKLTPFSISSYDSPNIVHRHQIKPLCKGKEIEIPSTSQTTLDDPIIDQQLAQKKSKRNGWKKTKLASSVKKHDALLYDIQPQTTLDDPIINKQLVQKKSKGNGWKKTKLASSVKKHDALLYDIQSQTTLDDPIINQQLVQKKSKGSGWKKTKLSSSVKKHDALLYGIPSTNNIKRYEKYVVSYDRCMKNPSWVAQHLLKEDLEKPTVAKRPKFKVDPKEFRVMWAIANAGYSKGHLAPSGDYSYSQKLAAETFIMSNVSPQIPEFNAGIWARLEEFVREVARTYNEVYVVTGPIYQSQKEKTMIRSLVAVPTHFFKVLLFKDNHQFLTQAFVIPHEKLPRKKNLKGFIRKLEFVEASSGLLFFEKVKSEISEADLCSKIPCDG